MQWTGLNDLREKYLAFFESKGHLRLPSFPLVPQGDQSLLLINSGMAPMKKYFTGEVTPPRARVTTCQKCIRTPDIERVGKTARHGTYFEMLGNFSFGDYFKTEATAWAWEFCTQVLEMPVDRLWISIYEEDEETFAFWTEQVGVAPDRLVRLGKEDNFWEHGTGPCGPCSEIYFDRGEAAGCGSPTCGVGCDCDRYVEFWNLVFTQFDSDGKGNYAPLAHPNIDTGMGLERLACILQGVGNLFEVDTVQAIMKHVSRIAGVTYGGDAVRDVSLRVITDHIRSTTFMVGDGVMPSNEGRGYVLRRLLRRAARHGRLLGIKRPFLYEVCDTVIAENAAAYPELSGKRDFICKLIHTEEEAFEKTIDSGLSLLDDMLHGLTGTVLSGADAFKLYDTYGFPVDLTRDICEEKGLTVDEDAFTALMKQQRERARTARKNAGADAWKGEVNIAETLSRTSFVGYEREEAAARVIAIIAENQLVESLQEGDLGAVVLDVSPFYGESGGQVGDTGELLLPDGQFVVETTAKTHSGVLVHAGVLAAGTLRVNDTVTAVVHAEARAAVTRNHTAAHLLQAALRKQLGTHVEQAGQWVTPERMRFDFTHFSALTQEELTQVEKQVNDWILAGLSTDIREMPIDEARALGAMALFGEKYGNVVRVVRVPEVSLELCGGTHVRNTACLGLFRIVSESSVAAGVRRIEAVTGLQVLELLQDYHSTLLRTAEVLKAAGTEDVLRRAAQVTADLKTALRELEAMQGRAAAVKLQGLFKDARVVAGIKIMAMAFTEMNADNIRAMCDRARDVAVGTAVVVLAGMQEETGVVSFGCYCSPKAQALGAHAGKIIKEVSHICGGNGGGRADIAMAGGKDLTKVDIALNAVDNIVERLVK